MAHTSKTMGPYRPWAYTTRDHGPIQPETMGLYNQRP